MSFESVLSVQGRFIDNSIAWLLSAHWSIRLILIVLLLVLIRRIYMLMIYNSRGDER